MIECTIKLELSQDGIDSKIKFNQSLISRLKSAKERYTIEFLKTGTIESYLLASRCREIINDLESEIEVLQ